MQFDQQGQQQFSFEEWSAPQPATSPKIPAHIQILWHQDRLTPGLRQAIYVKQLRRRCGFRALPLAELG